MSISPVQPRRPQTCYRFWRVKKRHSLYALLLALCLLFTIPPARELGVIRAASIQHTVTLGTNATTHLPLVLRVGYVTTDGANIRTAPSLNAAILTPTLYGISLPILDSTRDGSGKLWYHILLWGTVPAWVSSDVFALQPPDEASFSSEQGDGNTLDSTAGPHAAMLLAAAGRVSSPANLRVQPDLGAQLLTSNPLAVGTPLHIISWATDSDGHGWFEVHDADIAGWIYAAFVNLEAQNPTQTTRDGRPLSQLVAGKGMWFTNALPKYANLHALVTAARQAGLTHLYAEVAISNYGFYGADTLNNLLPLAHANGLKVIAWVYPFLNDLPGDVTMTAQVARYVAPTGDRPDGITADIETNLDAGDVKTYSQVVRQLLGANELMVATTYHPFAKPDYPYREVAQSWNVIAPMDYWHSRTRPYDYASAYRFVARSLATIRQAVGDPNFPIEELGQTYDMFSTTGSGQNGPSGQEIQADFQAAKDSRAVGISFFEWQTASAEEWVSIAGTSYGSLSLQPGIPTPPSLHLAMATPSSFQPVGAPLSQVKVLPKKQIMPAPNFDYPGPHHPW